MALIDEIVVLKMTNIHCRSWVEDVAPPCFFAEYARHQALVECIFSGLTGATRLIEQTVNCRSLQYLKFFNYEGDFANYKATRFANKDFGTPPQM